MTLSFEPITPLSVPGQRSSDASLPAGRSFGHPSDILNKPGLSLSDKRSILASWSSDARAVESSPSLRQLDDGTTVFVDDVLKALKTLDDLPVSMAKSGPPAGRPAWFNRRKGRPIRRWLHKAWRSCRPDKDDDDPPPCPASAAQSIRFSFALAYGGQPVRAASIAKLSPEGARQH